jgi:hypothetical protein
MLQTWMNPRASEISMNEIMYRFNHFNLGVMLGDMRFSRNALRPGAYVMDAPVTTLSGERTTLLRLPAQ